MQNFGKNVAAIIRSRIFFGVVISLFVLQAGWLAISARYPMAFDESYHVGIIKLYTHQLSPLFMSQPDGPAPFGALTRDPSYLYHWLLSFPYRLLSIWFNNQVLVVVLLRLLNVALFAAGLVLFRKVLLKTRASPTIVHLTILFFTLVPVVPLLAAHVNYDNLLMLLVPLSLLLTLQFHDRLVQRKLCSLPLLLNIFSLNLLGSLVKFAYLPILTANVLCILYLVWKHGKPRRKQWRKLTRVKKYPAVILCLVSIILFVQMYGVNIVRYHNIIPQCGQVLSVERCKAYPPWARNYDAKAHKVPDTGNPVAFVGGWLYGMFYRSFFAINGSGLVATYDNKPPLPILSAAAIAVFGFGSFFAFRYRQQIVGSDPALSILLFVCLVYLVSLLGRNYHDYAQLGQLVAINGRYLVLIMLPVLLAIGLAFQYHLRQHTQGLLVVVVFLAFLQGGGALSYIYDSNIHWYRSDSHFIQQTNLDLHDRLKPFILGWPDT